MIYPFGATVVNGCLRVIPKSHRRRHKLHDVLPEAHSVEANSLESSHVAFADQPDETSVEVGPSDVVFCDVRLLHATHANASNFERPCLTLWYLPNFDSLPDGFKAHYTQHPCQPSAAKRANLPPPVYHLVIPAVNITSAPVIQLERSPVSL
ncbi:MAG: phytanoyl-CoA dioxygenase family protein [Pseudonocardiaceae bacterium]